MSAAEALKAAYAAGIELRLDGDDLLLEASAPPPAAVLDLLSHHKAGIVTLLRPGAEGWSVEDWLAFFDERAGIAEFDGGLTPADAEAQAFESCIVEWLNRHPQRSDPSCCTWCGKPNREGHAIVPFGSEWHGCTWLHPECWNDWGQHRRRLATEELARIGIKPTTSPDAGEG